ncbi:HNH endonuclease signature motif containing protein [Arthrobacter cavernae]|uniref:DUF222 domain-containing protein n=1 Tax=Arthrobacter cavernae TaxID=2817681 RepID=A0A939HFR3_9MICC|nr:HNH endonuclease signature motif containing protein [Arthrobacter cavernae]MBO1266675.1 DUF222 domain-containing protein [Arthrobacter cavernae]
MEALVQLSSRQASQPGAASTALDGMLKGALDSMLAELQTIADSAADDVARLGLQDSAALASRLEELSRTLGYLQIVAAGQLDRVRSEAPAAAAGRVPGWTTGWGSGEQPRLEEAPASADPTAPSGMVSTTVSTVASTTAYSPSSSVTSSAAREFAQEFRNTGEYLRSLLRISAAEASRRLDLAAAVLPRQGLAGQPMPPRREELAAALASGSICTRSASTITMALDRVRPYSSPETAAAMEHALTRTAAENDPDFLARTARRWTDTLDQDGTEPSEEHLRHSQGAFLRRPRHGLHRLEVFATTDQFEHLLTVMNTATNPRTRTGSGQADTDNAAGSGPSADESGLGDATDRDAAGGQDPLDRRSRAQKMLDGLVGACKLALATGTLPATGGLRPQVLVTIDFQSLLAELHHHGTAPHDTGTAAGVGTDGGSGTRATDTRLRRGGNGPEIGRESSSGSGIGHSIHAVTGTGSFTFSGPATPRTIRKLACDADIIPVVLGSEGQILDIGRASRIFPPHIRKAITARDQGCAFPGCTIPAPWCEAHHINYWSRGGATSTNNGTLLCSHHHHLIHKENWHIEPREGVPWFIPPPHIDPRQTPRRNHYFHT